MNAPRLENSISWNSIFPVIVAIASAGIAWGLLQGRVSQAEARLEQIEAVAEAASQASALRETRLRTIENQQARSDERFSSILAYLARIDDRLERIEASGR